MSVTHGEAPLGLVERAGSGERLCCEGRAAATGFLGLRILKLEPAAHEAGLVVNGRTIEIEVTFCVDENFHSLVLEDGIVLLWSGLIKAQDITHPGTSPTLDPDTQAQVGLPLFLEEPFDFLTCGWRQQNHRRFLLVTIGKCIISRATESSNEGSIGRRETIPSELTRKNPS